MMKTTLLLAALALSGNAFAADCEAMAAEKKLAGAAKTSYMKKCAKDQAGGDAVSPVCAKSAADKKLAGAAKTAHLKKCMADGGTAAKG